MWQVTLVLSTVVALAAVEGYPQYFIQSPMDTTIQQNHTVVLKCIIGDRKGAVQWTKGGFSLGFNTTIPGFPRYSIETGYGGNEGDEFSLKINPVTLEDDDEYSCQVLPWGENDPPLIARATLNVIVPCEQPTIVNYHNGSSLEVAYTRKVVNLVCEARNGKPAATLEWYRNGRRVVDDIEAITVSATTSKLVTARSTLTVQVPDDTRQAQNGDRYTCEAKHSALITGISLTTTISLNVLYPPGDPQLTGYDGRMLKVNDTLDLTCTSTGGNPTGSVYWYRGSQGLDWSFTSSPDHSRGISRAINHYNHVVSSSDEGKVFMCKVTSEGEGMRSLPDKTANYTLNVSFPPSRIKMTGGEEPVKTGESVTLTCTTSNSNPKANIKWFAHNRPLRDVPETYQRSDQGGWITTSSHTIRVGAGDHDMIYTCQSSHSEYTHTVADTQNLKVIFPPGAPKFVGGPTQGQALRAGTNTKLRCQSMGGNPVATLEWYKGNTLLRHANHFDSVKFASSEITIRVQPDDNGAIYKCKARNPAIETPLVVETRLLVNFPSTTVSITPRPSSGRVRVGQQVDLTCQSSSSNPAASITWTRNGRRTDVQGTNLGETNAENGGKNTTNRLTLRASSKDHGAVYGCRATNRALDESVSDALTLDVLFKPEFDIATLPSLWELKRGQQGSMNITVNANPPEVSYQLSRFDSNQRSGGRVSSQPLPPHFVLRGGILNISQAEKSDRGEYMIRATNAEGSTTFNFSLVVKYGAIISSISDPQSADEGEQATFRCEADAYPIVPNMFTWYREGFDMTRFRMRQKGNVSTLTVSHLRREDTGNFKCTVDNRIGSPVSKEANLIVKFSPVIDKSPEHSRSAGQKGTDVTLRCKANGAPKVSITWTRNNTQVQSGKKFNITTSDSGSAHESFLKVRAMTLADYGAYVCTASNAKGSDSHSITLAGTTKPYQPYNIKWVNSTARSITIAWKAGFNGGLAQSFRVRYKPVDARGYVYVDVRPFGALFYKITGLKMDTSYEFTVLAFNELGESAYQARGITAKTLDKEVPADVATSELQGSDETPVIIILVVCIVGVFILTLNVGLILFFIRKRKKRMEGASDTGSHTNNFELYGSDNKGDHNMYPAPPSDDTRSYGTYDKSMDDFSDDYIREYDSNCFRFGCSNQPPSTTTTTSSISTAQPPSSSSPAHVKTQPQNQYAKVLTELESFNALRPATDTNPLGSQDTLKAISIEGRELLSLSMAVTRDRSRRRPDSSPDTNTTTTDYPGSRPYSPTQKLGPCESPRLLGGGTKTYNIADDRPGRISPWSEDPLYKRAQPSRNKNPYENGIPNGDVYEFKSARGKGMNELSDRPSSRPPSRTGKTPPLPPVRSSSRCGSLGLPTKTTNNIYGEEAVVEDFSNNISPLGADCDGEEEEREVHSTFYGGGGSMPRPPLVPARNYQSHDTFSSPMPPPPSSQHPPSTLTFTGSSSISPSHHHSPPPAPRYAPMPGSSSVLSPNIVANPNYNGPVTTFSNGGPKPYSTSSASINRQHHYHPGNSTSNLSRTSPTPYSGRPSPSPHNTVPAGSEFRGHLV